MTSISLHSRLVRIIRSLAAVAMPALLISAIIIIGGMSFAGITTTKHNLSTSGAGNYHTLAGGRADQICIFCHIPHGGNTTVPLWNRGNSAATYTMYSSPTLNMTIATSPNQISLACLSCHDGTMAFDQLIYKPGAAISWNNGQAQLGATDLSNIHPDLRDDHPISITYEDGKDPNIMPIAVVKSNGFPFYGASKDKLECTTCHDAHENPYTYFLRKPTNTICLECHIK